MIYDTDHQPVVSRAKGSNSDCKNRLKLGLIICPSVQEIANLSNQRRNDLQLLCPRFPPRSPAKQGLPLPPSVHIVYAAGEK